MLCLVGRVTRVRAIPCRSLLVCRLPSLACGIFAWKNGNVVGQALRLPGLMGRRCARPTILLVPASPRQGHRRLFRSFCEQLDQLIFPQAGDGVAAVAARFVAQWNNDRAAVWDALDLT